MNNRELSYWRRAVWHTLMTTDDTSSCPFMSLWYGCLIDRGLLKGPI